MEKRKMNNKGFSLVELIIVIAIMAVLIGILAPQYLRYVQQSRVSTDIQNAQQIATAINVAIADGTTTNFGISSGVAYGAGTSINNIPGFTSLPESRVDATRQWNITWNFTDGVTSITLGGQDIYPDVSYN